MVCVRGAQVPPMHAHMAYDVYAQGKTRKTSKRSKMVGHCKSDQKVKRGKTAQKKARKEEKKKKNSQQEAQHQGIMSQSLKQKKTRAERTKHCAKRGIVAVENSVTTNGQN